MRAAFHTLGCKTNSYETQAVLEQFQNNGFETVSFDEPADVYVINTCSVTGEAARKSRQMLHRCRKLNPDAVVVAAGCYAQEAYDILSEDDQIDLIVGNNEKNNIIRLVLKELADKNKYKSYKTEGKLVDDLTLCSEFEEQLITNQGSHVRAYVKIQDGCNRFCSYCIIPYLRGRSRSRDIKDIVSEVKILAGNGYKEIVLTGIDISDYSFGSLRLIDVLEALDKIEGIERIRLGSLEVNVIDKDFAERASACRTLCPHFHLSLQSGSDSVLKRMNRKYNTDEFKNAVDLLRTHFDDPGITTDIIVGFPGETDREFDETCAFALKTGFSRTHVFKYSRRKGTNADKMPDQITEKEKSLRSEKLIKITDRLQNEYEQRWIGKSVDILIEEKEQIGDREYAAGYTPEYIRCRSDKNLKINEIISIIYTGN